MYVEYHLLIVKMHVESSKSEIIYKNLHVLCDVKLIFGFPFIRLMLKCVHALIKISQSQDVYDFVESIRLAQQKLYQFYCHLVAKYEDLVLDDFNLVEVLTNFPLELDF